MASANRASLAYLWSCFHPHHSRQMASVDGVNQRCFSSASQGNIETESSHIHQPTITLLNSAPSFPVSAIQ